MNSTAPSAPRSDAFLPVDTCAVCGIKVSWKPHLPGNIHPEEIRPDDVRVTDHQYGKRWTMVRCPHCGFVTACPRPSASLLIRLYQKMDDPDYARERRGRKKNFIQILKRLEAWRPQKGRLLDVGAASGLMVEAAIERGWDALGIEPSQALVKQARELGLPVIETTLEAWQGPESAFDVITLLDVIEHVAEPDRFLSKALQYLKPGGIVCIVTPDVGSLTARLLGSRWWHYRPAHVTFFTRRALTRLIESRGGRVLTIRPYIWHFTVDYLTSRLHHGRPVPGLPRWIRKLQIPVNFFDSIELYAEWP